MILISQKNTLEPKFPNNNHLHEQLIVLRITTTQASLTNHFGES